MGLTPRQTAGRAHRATGPASGTGPIPAAQSDGAPRDRVCPIPAPRPMAVRAAALVLARSQRLASTGRAELHRGALRGTVRACRAKHGSAARPAEPCSRNLRVSGWVGSARHCAPRIDENAVLRPYRRRRPASGRHAGTRVWRRAGLVSESTLGPAFVLARVRRSGMIALFVWPRYCEKGANTSYATPTLTVAAEDWLWLPTACRVRWWMAICDRARVARGAGARSVSRGYPCDQKSRPR